MRLVHLSRLSGDEEILHFARRVNTQFLKSGKTELQKLDSECEAVYLREGTAVASIVVFYRLEDATSCEYYLPVVWTNPRFRGQGCYFRLLQWLKRYAADKGARRLSTDVVHDNRQMIVLMDRHWGKTFIRFNLAL